MIKQTNVMNERIQELAYEAEDYADSIVYQGGEFHPAYTKKFAELIVRECANKVKDFYQEDEFSCYNAAEEIKQHFGVNE